MVSAVSSSSAALKVLQVQAPQQASTGGQNQDPLHRFLDPRSVLALGPQSFDTLLKLRAELRRDPVQDAQAQKQAPQVQNEVPPTPKAGRPRHSGMLAWENEGTSVETSNLDRWKERMRFLQAHSFDPRVQLVPHLEVPLNSPLSPWNSPDVIEQLKDMDRHGAISSSRERAFLASDAAIYKGMTETPPEDVARIKAKGGEIWYNDMQFSDRPSDKEFFRDIKNYALYGGSLDEPIDPSNELSQALLKGTAQMIRGSSIPGFYYRPYSYTMYAHNSDADQYKWIGGFGGAEGNEDQIIMDLEKKNPTMKVTYIAADGDIAFILYPKSGSATPTVTAAAQSSTAGTGTDQTTAAVR